MSRRVSYARDERAQGYADGKRESARLLADVRRENERLRAKAEDVLRTGGHWLGDMTEQAAECSRASAFMGAMERLASAVHGCGKRCDHDSPCVLLRGHRPADRHETEHGCIFYDPDPTE